MNNPNSTKSLEELKFKFAKLWAHRDRTDADLKTTRREIEEHQRFIGIADKVTDALEVLSEQLFQSLLFNAL